MSSNPRIRKAEISGLYGGLVKSFSRRMPGEVPEPAEVMWHNRDVLKSIYGLGRKADKWNECDKNHLWARSNTAIGIESQGFSKSCELPLAEPSNVASPA